MTFHMTSYIQARDDEMRVKNNNILAAKPVGNAKALT